MQGAFVSGWIYPRSVENILVEVGADGAPVVLKVGGHRWLVADGCLRWYERVNWWESVRRVQRGSGVKVDIEVWRVQARIGRNPRSALVTFDLVFDDLGGGWLLREQHSLAA